MMNLHPEGIGEPIRPARDELRLPEEPQKQEEEEQDQYLNLLERDGSQVLVLSGH